MDMVARCPELQGDHVTVPPEVPLTWVAAQHRYLVFLMKLLMNPSLDTVINLL